MTLLAIKFELIVFFCKSLESFKKIPKKLNNWEISQMLDIVIIRENILKIHTTV